jgi:hypothetical protein
MTLLIDESKDTDADLSDPAELARRYVALWNEPDPAVRRDLVRQLWAEDGGQTTSSPQEVVAVATAVGFPGPPLVVRGYRQLDTRVDRAYEEFVGSGRYVFRGAGTPARLGDVVKLNWEMVENATGEVVGAGLDVLLLDRGDRIEEDYQFILELTAPRPGQPGSED